MYMYTREGEIYSSAYSRIYWYTCTCTCSCTMYNVRVHLHMKKTVMVGPDKHVHVNGYTYIVHLYRCVHVHCTCTCICMYMCSYMYSLPSMSCGVPNWVSPRNADHDYTTCTCIWKTDHFTDFGKWVMTSVRFSGSILSCSAVNLSISCRLMVRKTELRKVRPKMSVASYFWRLSQNTGTWQKLTHLYVCTCTCVCACKCTYNIHIHTHIVHVHVHVYTFVYIVYVYISIAH